MENKMDKNYKPQAKVSKSMKFALCSESIPNYLTEQLYRRSEKIPKDTSESPSENQSESNIPSIPYRKTNF